MKHKFLKFILSSCVFIILFVSSLYANKLKNIVIDVLVKDDGGATIKEAWAGTFNNGTENYIPINTRDGLSVSNFRVWLNDKEYEYVDYWDTDRSFREKKYRCGINETYDGIELCFGISEYGENTYYFTYDVAPLFKSYVECDAFNFRFINDKIKILDADVRLNIHFQNGTKVDTSNAKIWAFGFDGEINFYDGNVIAYSNSRLTSRNYLNVMMAIEKNIISPKVTANQSFEELKDKAFAGSSYAEIEKGYIGGFDIFDIAFILVPLGIIFLFFYRLIKNIVREYKLKKFYKSVDCFRDIPNDKNILVTNSLYKDFDIWKNKDSNVLGALIVKLINEGVLEAATKKEVGFFGKEKVTTELKISKEPTSKIEKMLYDIIVAAKGDDMILQENELKNYAENNCEEMINFINHIDSEGHNEINRKGYYKKVLTKDLNGLSDEGKDALKEVYGLRKFLSEFTLLNEKDILASVLWDDLMVYATLFGIAKKVLKELKNLYPDDNLMTTRIENYTRTIYIGDIYYRALFYSAFRERNRREMTRLARMAASGMGGHASFGGGGGFSGGGSAGGSR